MSSRLLSLFLLLLAWFVRSLTLSLFRSLISLTYPPTHPPTPSLAHPRAVQVMRLLLSPSTSTDMFDETAAQALGVDIETAQVSRMDFVHAIFTIHESRLTFSKSLQVYSVECGVWSVCMCVCVCM
jgi:hypothetical protein